MHEAIYEKLKDVARAQTCIIYGEIAPLAGLNMEEPADRNAMSHILEEISTSEHDRGRPMLTAVVVHAGSSTPGQGFFTLAKHLGLFMGQDQLAELKLFVRELERVHAAWEKAPA